MILKPVEIKHLKMPRLHTFDSLLFYRDYRLLWTGNFLSYTAQWLQLLTISWLVRELTIGSSTSVLQVVSVGGLSTLPVLLVGPWGGVWGDRVDRRKLLMRIQTFMAILAVCFALLVVSDRGVELSDQWRVWLVYCYVLVSGVCLAIAQPMRQAFIANTVPPAAYGNAYATNVFSVTGTRIIGPLVGGILIGNLGFTANCLLEASLYAATVLVYFPMKAPFENRPTITRQSPVADFGAGIRFIRRERRIILTLILLGLIPNVVLHQLWFLLPVFTADVIHGDASTGGLLLSATGIGGLTSAVIIASVGFTFRKGLVALASILFSSIFVILFAKSGWIVPAFPLLPALVLIGLMSLAQSHYRTTSGTMIQIVATDKFRSRVTSLAHYGQGFVFPFSILVGILAGFSGVVIAITVLGMIGLGLSLFFTIRLKDLRHEP